MKKKAYKQFHQGKGIAKTSSGHKPMQWISSSYLDTYNAETGLYEKSINSKPHLMQSGEVLSVKNIIVELITDTSLGDGTVRRNINTTGTGKGYYFTNDYKRYQPFGRRCN